MKKITIFMLAALTSCAPDIAPVSVAECEIRETIATVQYLRTEAIQRIERTRRLRQAAALQAAQVDTLASFFNGTRPVFSTSN